MSLPEERRAGLVTLGTVLAAMVLVLTALLAGSEPAAGEISVFVAVNGLPDVPAVLWWPVMQLGSLVGTLLVAAGFALFGHRRLATAYAAATVAAWLGAQLLKVIVDRGRPADFAIDAIMRGSAASGQGFPSGHAAVAFAAAFVVSAGHGRPWSYVALTLAGVVATARLYVGAHLPLDVVGGGAAGVVVGLVASHLILRLRSERLGGVAGTPAE
jgi:undecaprenyl-diphosphatase